MLQSSGVATLLGIVTESQTKRLWQLTQRAHLTTLLRLIQLQQLSYVGGVTVSITPGLTAHNVVVLFKVHYKLTMLLPPRQSRELWLTKEVAQ